jgi:hypothetical protein
MCDERTYDYDTRGVITGGSRWIQDGRRIIIGRVSHDHPYTKIRLWVKNDQESEEYSVRVFINEGNARFHIHRYSKTDLTTGEFIHDRYDPVPKIPLWFELLTTD